MLNKPNGIVQPTEGPWVWAPSGEANFYRLGVDQGGRVIKWLASIQMNGELMEAKQVANMKAIAATPALVSALEALVDWGRNHTSPSDPNSPHKLLIDAVEVLQRVRGEKL